MVGVLLRNRSGTFRGRVSLAVTPGPYGCGPRRTRIMLLLLGGRTIVDVWLTLTIFMSFPDLGLSFLFPVVRYTLGWYVARSYALVASCMVLSVMIIETMLLYSRLANAIIMQRRERAAGFRGSAAFAALMDAPAPPPRTGTSRRRSPESQLLVGMSRAPSNDRRNTASKLPPVIAPSA
jgi:hypothetical protein